MLLIVPNHTIVCRTHPVRAGGGPVEMLTKNISWCREAHRLRVVRWTETSKWSFNTLEVIRRFDINTGREHKIVTYSEASVWVKASLVFIPVNLNKIQQHQNDTLSLYTSQYVEQTASPDSINQWPLTPPSV